MQTQRLQRTPSHDIDRERVRDRLDDALRYARERDYAGWDPYDGLNSPVLEPVARNWFLRLVCMHGVHKAPVNLRPLLRIPKERNAKGIALFATASLDAYERTGDREYLAEAEDLLTWLRENQSAESARAAWGYNFDWQNSNKFFLPAEYPSIVASVFCAQAFVRHYEVTGEESSLAVAEDTCRFIREEINTVECGEHDALAYTPYDEYVVVNANALGASLLAVVGDATDDEASLERADEIVDLVLDVQDEKGAWYYSVPSNGSHLSHDNFHTGFVLESLHDYLAVRPDERVREAYEKGLDFYRRRLFEDDGAPKFEHDSSYPRDVHASAQAIRTFVKDGSAASLDRAAQVLEWTTDNLYDDDGYFYRRRGRVLSDTTPYMRWNQAWMCYALGSVLRHVP
ncbi:hypothetical protein [Halomarina pelagica]|uniref:hypothetical protein n=1 Tax=Halomarina pelagica TaxID=2961599 RepID=UPI0020C415D1|nr:hypothetical protein [Halomarina sp. BND7]